MAVRCLPQVEDKTRVIGPHPSFPASIRADLGTGLGTQGLRETLLNELKNESDRPMSVHRYL